MSYPEVSFLVTAAQGLAILARVAKRTENVRNLNGKLTYGSARTVEELMPLIEQDQNAKLFLFAHGWRPSADGFFFDPEKVERVVYDDNKESK